MLFKKIFRILADFPKVWKVLLIFLVVFLAYYKTLEMYVWQDDHATMFKLQHLSEGAGQFGTGIYDRNSAYRGIFVLLAPIYYFFGTDTRFYYLAGIIAYSLAAVSVYFLATALTQNRKIALASSLIFAAGFVGAETLWRITNSIHTSHTIIFVCLVLGFYKKFIDSAKSSMIRKLILYICSFILFVYAIETGFVRAHGIILLVVGLEFLWNFNLPFSFLRLAPFIYGYYHYYIRGNPSGYEISGLLQEIFVKQNLELLLVPLRNLQNMFLPSQWAVSLFIFLVGLIFLLLKVRQKVLFYSIFFMLANYLVYYVHTPTQIFPSIHRYFSLSLVGFSLFVAYIIAYFSGRKRSYYWTIGVVVILHLILVNKEQSLFIEERSIPSRKFYQSLKKELPTLPKGSSVYFDIEDDPKSTSEFANFFGVGSMPNTTAIAWHYEIDRYDFTMPSTFMELLSLLKKGETKSDLIYTFYYDADLGLINTTGTTRQALFGPTQSLVTGDPKKINFQFASPIEITMNISTALDVSSIKYTGKINDDLSHYLGYLESKDDYYDKVEAQALSEWKYQEVRNLIDKDVNTTWWGHRLNWFYEHFESVTLDLGEERDLGAIKMSYSSKNLVPTNYSYFCSTDRKSWTKIGTFSIAPFQDSGFIIDKFTPRRCLLIKLEVTKTAADDSPMIAELEAIESRFADIDFRKADGIYEDPFSFLSTPSDLKVLAKFLRKNGVNARACLFTDKRDIPFCQKIKLSIGSTKTYSFIAPANGTILKSVEVQVPSGVSVKIENTNISQLTFSTLKKMNYILDYKEN